MIGMGYKAYEKDQVIRSVMDSSTVLEPVSDVSTPEEYVCWSRMQAEAGQALEDIVARKERERRAGKGIFLWGVGNAPATIARVLARTELPVRVIFSIMKTPPKTVDSAPDKVVAWRSYIDANGIERELPPHMLVTSRANSAKGPKKTHYALMCRSREPLELKYGEEPFDPSAFRNAGGTGAPVGASQVTALVRRVTEGSGDSGYEANLSAWLTDSYWVRLIDPIEITAKKAKMLATLNDAAQTQWTDVVKALRSGPSLKQVGVDKAVLI